jgi:hypothetical protein
MGDVAIDKEFVAIKYIKTKEGVAQVLDMPVSTTGQFLTSWPGGFFAERLNEVLGA